MCGKQHRDHWINFAPNFMIIVLSDWRNVTDSVSLKSFKFPTDFYVKGVEGQKTKLNLL